jgi:hypothetical protein
VFKVDPEEVGMTAAISVVLCIAGVIFMLWFLVWLHKDRRVASVCYVISVAYRNQEPIQQRRLEPIPLGAIAKPAEKAVRASWHLDFVRGSEKPKIRVLVLQDLFCRQDLPDLRTSFHQAGIGVEPGAYSVAARKAPKKSIRDKTPWK